jgi:hypothetical protein
MNTKIKRRQPINQGGKNLLFLPMYFKNITFSVVDINTQSKMSFNNKLLVNFSPIKANSLLPRVLNTDHVLFSLNN